MRQLVVFALAAAVLAFSAGPVHADRNVSEAEDFFRQMAASDNPYISRTGHEGLEKLRNRDFSDKISVEIPLMSRNNSSLAVPTVLNQKVMGTFLVDTGASYTVITPRIAEKLGIEVTEKTPRVRIVTANGHISAPRVTVPSITIGGVEIRDVEVIIQPLGNDLLLAGLLGMNFFKDMDIAFKQNKMILTVNRPLEAASAETR